MCAIISTPLKVTYESDVCRDEKIKRDDIVNRLALVDETCPSAGNPSFGGKVLATRREGRSS